MFPGFYPHLHQGFCQLNGGLAAKLHDSTVRFLYIYHILHILWSQRFKIQLICNVKVCTYGFRVVIDDNGLIAFFLERPCTVYGTKVKFNTLTDPDGTGAKNQDLFLL